MICGTEKCSHHPIVFVAHSLCLSSVVKLLDVQQFFRCGAANRGMRWDPQAHTVAIAGMAPLDRSSGGSIRPTPEWLH